MCGVVGLLAFDNAATKEEEKLRQESMIYLGSELLEQTQDRGKDATGVAALFDNCDYMLQKMGIPAQEFLSRFGDTEKDFEGFLKIWRRKKHPARVFIGHCRKSSVGNTDDNANNHPIKVGDIVGIHNGTLSNHEKIFKKLEGARDGTVDSEAIFRLIHKLSNNGNEPFSKELLLETCQRLHGSYCCLTFSGNNPYQMAAFRDGRPLEAAIIRPLKLLVLASETKFIKKALWNYNKMAHLYGGAKNFIPLSKDDVDTKFMPDDSIFLFDLRREVGAKTEIDDLCETSKIPRIDKLWGNTVKKTTYGNTAGTGAAKPTAGNTGEGNATGKKSLSNQSKSKDNTGTSETSSEEGGSEEQSGQSKRGRVWNTAKTAYDVSSDKNLDDIEGVESVEVNTETGEVATPDHSAVIKEGEEINKTFSKGDAPPKAKFELADTTKETINSEPTSTAKINQIDIKPASDEAEIHTKNVINHLRSIAGEGTAVGVKKEIDMKTHPKVLERAGGLASALEKFKTDDDICNFLEIANATDLTNMPLPALMNRAQKKMMSDAWYSGYTARMIEKGDGELLDLRGGNNARTMIGRMRSKKLEGQNKIRQLKVLINLLSEASGVSYPELDGFVTKAMNRGDEITTQMLNTIFSPGDLRGNKVMRNLVNLVQTKEGR